MELLRTYKTAHTTPALHRIRPRLATRAILDIHWRGVARSSVRPAVSGRVNGQPATLLVGHVLSVLFIIKKHPYFIY